MNTFLCLWFYQEKITWDKHNLPNNGEAEKALFGVQVKVFATKMEETTIKTGNKNSPVKKSTSCEWAGDPNAPRFYCVKNKVIVVMGMETKFCFTGKLSIRVLYGAVEVYGCVINTISGSREVYSPRGYSNVAIQTSEKYVDDDQTDVWVHLCAEGINRNTENRLRVDINQIHPGMAVVMLSNFENKLTKFLNDFYQFRLFPNIKNHSYYCWTDTRKAEVILQSNLHFGDFSCKELIVDPCLSVEIKNKMLSYWHEKEWSCTLIAGGKSVGKSTAVRCLINNLLPVSKMAVLVDVDIGQAECTLPGCISYSLIEQPLTGPNFTHLKIPVYQLYIGDIDASRCITRYIQGLKVLFDKLSSCPTLSRLPIIVNTMGFTHGIGWDIIVYTIKLMQPSIVVQITSKKPRNNYANFLSSHVINQQKVTRNLWGTNIINWSRPCKHELRVIETQAEQRSMQRNECWNMEPYQQRELVVISYLSEIIKIGDNSTQCYGTELLSINGIVPYVIPFRNLTISIVRASVPPSHVFNVINGNIVALCGIDFTDEVPREAEESEGPRVLTRTPLCPCYGFGIVRGVDMERQEVFINTPLPSFIMQSVNCLVGCIQIPVTLLKLSEQSNVPYIGGNDGLPTSRDPRRGYFRMRYQITENNR